MLNIKVTINRKHLQDGEEQGAVHSPRFPFNKYEKLWILISDPAKNFVYYIKKVTQQSKVVIDDNFKIYLGGPPFMLRAGNYQWQVAVKSDSYWNVDAIVPLNFTVLTESEVIKEIYVHPDDENLEYQPSWIQQIVSGQQVESESSEEEDIPELENEELDDLVD